MKPLRQSNFSTACMRPRLPSWIRSRSGRPDAWYFFAIDTTSRRFDCTKVRCGVFAAARGPPELTLLRRGQTLRAGGQLLAGGVATLDLLGQAYLVVLGEERVLPDVGQVEPNEIFLVALDTFFRH